MRPRLKPPQHDFLRVLHILGVAVAPLERDLAVGVGVDEHVEGAGVGEQGEEGDGGGDLPEEGLDLFLDVFVGYRGGWGGGVEIFFVGC